MSNRDYRPRKQPLSAIEYGLIAALIAVAVIAAATILGPVVMEMFGSK
jgi:Flp pilus assembly pilin Flp